MEFNGNVLVLIISFNNKFEEWKIGREIFINNHLVKGI